MIENNIFAALIFDEEFNKAALPYIKKEYFSEPHKKILFDIISSFCYKYGKRPSINSLAVDLQSVAGYNEDIIKEVADYFENIEEFIKDVDKTWLLEKTEKFCQEKAIYNGIMDSIAILNNEDDKKRSTGAIPQILSDSLAISFNKSVGHDFIEDAPERFDFYHKVENKVEFDIDYLNKITGGGLPSKSLNIILAGTGVGKSLVMCHFAAANLVKGKNVLYITLEMAEERIAERIDANLLDIDISALKLLNKNTYSSKIKKLKDKVKGKIIIKEFATATAGALAFDSLLTELKIKKRFIPDMIYIDYINICKSDRYAAGSFNSYTTIKSVAEELRGLSMVHNLPVVSAVQANRAGINATDLTLSETSESIGLPQTADLMVGLISTEELEDRGQLLFKQLKNRYNDVSNPRKFVVGVDRSKMRLYNVDNSQQPQLDLSEEGVKDTRQKRHKKTSSQSDDTPLFDKSAFGSRAKEDDNMKWSTKKMGRKDFSSLR